MSLYDIGDEAGLEDFGRCHVPALKAYLQQRNISVTGRKKSELQALAFAANTLKIPVNASVLEEEISRQLRYLRLLPTDDGDFPDPIKLDQGWETEDTGMSKWPPTFLADISDYLRKHETDIESAGLRKRLLRDYKEGKAFSYFSSQFLFEVNYHHVGTDKKYCILKSKCIPSQKISAMPHDVWVVIHKKNGEIHSAYCSCLAG
ncbi:uncharacterized protein [Ptychodera flava]|uniref:uncharacterized protein n=1 Tax=Ptychodera flava TaxID=63121 RepID=UPI003969F628